MDLLNVSFIISEQIDMCYMGKDIWLKKANGDVIIIEDKNIIIVVMKKCYIIVPCVTTFSENFIYIDLGETELLIEDRANPI